VGWHVYSPDGINNWTDGGLAFGPRSYQKIFCYEGSTTCTQWYKMERPSVVLQDGHPSHITWAVADVDKDNQVLPGTNHGTKIVVVPFDGVTFDADFGVGAGGSAGTGGAGTGGVSSTGGSGGKNGTAGAAGSTGGLTSSGGSNGVGGSTSGSGTGGSTSGSGTGGSTATGGVSTAAAGAMATGGAVSSSAGGQVAAGGRLAAGGAPASGGSNADAGSDAGGCGCRVAGGPAPSKSLAILGIIALLSRRRSRRRNEQDRSGTR